MKDNLRGVKSAHKGGHELGKCQRTWTGGGRGGHWPPVNLQPIAALMPHELPQHDAPCTEKTFGQVIYIMATS